MSTEIFISGDTTSCARRPRQSPLMISSLTLTDEGKTEDRVRTVRYLHSRLYSLKENERKKCFRDDQKEVCIFDHVDQTLPEGTDVTFMSQDDCAQLNTLQ